MVFITIALMVVFFFFLGGGAEDFSFMSIVSALKLMKIGLHNILGMRLVYCRF